MKKLLLVSLLVAGLLSLSACTGGGAPAITITFGQGAAQAIDQGQSISFTVTVANDPNNKGVTWTLTGTACPACGMLTNVTITSATYNAPPSVSGNITVTITATSATDTSKSKSVMVTVSLPPTITTTSLPAGTQGTAYGPGASVQATGGAGTVTFSVSAGTFPPGLTLASNGSISGTPNATAPAQTFNFTVKVTDSSNASTQGTDSKPLSIVISRPPPPALSPTGGALPAGTEGTTYNQTITVNNGLAPFTTTVTGTLPAGLTPTVSPAGSTVTIAGTPTGPPGPSNFTITAKDSSNPQQSDTQNYSITINLPPAPKLSPTGGALPAGTEGTLYSQNITVSNGLAPFTFTVTAGSLPAGLSKSSSGNTFTISGTPTGPNGTSNFTLQVTDSSNPTQSDTQNYSITVNLPPPPSITTTSLPTGNQGSPYNQTISATGGLKPYTFSLASGSGPLPTGLMLTTNASNQGVVSGTPTVQGTFNFSIVVTDTSNPPQTSAPQAYSVVINPPAPLSITTPSPLPNGAFPNTPYNATISATGGIAPYTFSLDAASSPLPAGLTLTTNMATNQGVISGTPTTAGMFTNIIIDVSDSETPAKTAKSPAYMLTITAPMIVVSPATLPSGTVGTAYSVNITASGGVQPFLFSLDATSALPPAGLMFSSTATQATISGTPTAAGTTSGIIVDVKDSESPPVTQKMTYSLTINPSAAACPSGNEKLFTGQYAFLFQGYNASGPVAIAGTFNADGTGKIATLVGLEDINNSAGVQTSVAINSAGSSYSVGSDNRGCLTIATGSGTSVYRFALGSISAGVATKGRMIEFDSTGTLGSGVIRLQNAAAFSNAAISGGYAFGAASTLSLAGGTMSRPRFGVVAAFTANGAGGITAGELDFNNSGMVDGGTPGPLSILNTSMYNVASANGRGTLTLNIGGVPNPVHTSFYVVSASELLFMSIDLQASGNAPFTGTALGQSGGPFSPSSLSGNSVLNLGGLCGGCGPGSTVAPNLLVGVINVSTAGSFSFAGDQNKGGSVSPQSIPSGMYTVDSSGRVLITPTGAPSPIAAAYLVSPNRGFVLNVDPSVQTGTLEPQTGGSFTNASLNATFFFGTTNQTEQNVGDNSGVATFDGVSAVTGTNDNASLGGLKAGGTISATYSVTNGTGTPGRGTITSGGTTVLIFYIVSPSKAVLLQSEPTNTNPSIQVGEQ